MTPLCYHPDLLWLQTFPTSIALAQQWGQLAVGHRHSLASFYGGGTQRPAAPSHTYLLPSAGTPNNFCPMPYLLPLYCSAPLPTPTWDGHQCVLTLQLYGTCFRRWVCGWVNSNYLAFNPFVWPTPSNPFGTFVVLNCYSRPYPCAFCHTCCQTWMAMLCVLSHQWSNRCAMWWWWWCFYCWETLLFTTFSPACCACLPHDGYTLACTVLLCLPQHFPQHLWCIQFYM